MTESTAPDINQARLHGLDAVRAAALLLGIVLHGALSFVPDLDLAVWPVQDNQKSRTLALTVYVIHIFRMSVFFMVAGFFARLLLQRRGLAEFYRNRFQRIAIPLVLGWIVSIIAILGVVTWLMSRQGITTLDAVPAELRTAGLSFLHLWFLYILLWLYASMLLLRALVLRSKRASAGLALADRLFGVLLRSHPGLLLLAIPVGVAPIMVSRPSELGVGVPTPAYSLIPPLPPLFIYWYVFVMGWMLERERSLLLVLEGRALGNLALGSLATVTSLAVLHAEFAFTFVYAIALLTLSFAWIGLGMRFFDRERTRVRYVADASYWMYIMHLPLVMAVQTSLMSLPWHWAVKFSIVACSSVAILLVSYHYLVRSTWLGRLLNGRRYVNGVVVQSPQFALSAKRGD